MDTATRDHNIATWLSDAPQPVRETTNQLLERIALLRAEQTIYPAQDDILNASPTRRPTRSKLSS